MSLQVQLETDLMCFRYHGYNPALVSRFCEMGFDVPTVVSAMEGCQIDKNGGQNYRPSDDKMSDVMSRLIGE
jgi:ubiquitin-conjugating enzyme (huntingtin interacting protein 2)